MSATDRFDLGGRSLREHAARGTVINALFMIALSSLALVKGFIVAVFLDRADYGVWGIVVVCLTTLLWLRDNAGRLGVRSDQLAVGGPSAGGGLTAAVTLYARDRGGYLLGLCDQAEAQGDAVCLVHLTCEVAALEARVTNPSRTAFNKLTLERLVHLQC